MTQAVIRVGVEDEGAVASLLEGQATESLAGVFEFGGGLGKVEGCGLQAMTEERMVGQLQGQFRLGRDLQHLQSMSHGRAGGRGEYLAGEFGWLVSDFARCRLAQGDHGAGIAGCQRQLESDAAEAGMMQFELAGDSPGFAGVRR
jgi:hypothetical protein